MAFQSLISYEIVVEVPGSVTEMYAKAMARQISNIVGPPVSLYRLPAHIVQADEDTMRILVQRFENANG